MDEKALLAAIWANPADDAPRLAYADWLDDRGDADRAEFVRVQIAIARSPVPDDALKNREKVLLDAHRDEWLGDRANLDLGDGIDRSDLWRFRRGFPDTLALGDEEAAAHAPSRFLVGIGDEEAAALAESPLLANLSTLDLGKYRAGIYLREDIGDAGAQAIAASPHLANLTTLDLGGNAISDEGAHALAASPHLANLTTLLLDFNEVSDAGAQALAESPFLANLTRLHLDSNGIGDEGAAALRARFPFVQL